VIKLLECFLILLISTAADLGALMSALM